MSKQKKINDPNATKPDDLYEDAPPKIEDEEVEKPKGSVTNKRAMTESKGAKYIQQLLLTLQLLHRP